MIIKLKYKDGVIVEKLIPKKYEKGSSKMRLSYIDEPKKKRLSPMERFILAELTWRQELHDNILNYLGERTPEQVVIQTNRAGEERYLIRYKKEGGERAAKRLIVPTWVYKVCPKGKISWENLDWS